MATRVYSTLFVEVLAADANAGYTVPDGYIAVVRDICVTFFGAPGDTAASVLNLSTDGHIFDALQVDVNQYFHQELRQVFVAGDTISAQSSGPNEVGMRVCGYLLSLA